MNKNEKFPSIRIVTLDRNIHTEKPLGCISKYPICVTDLPQICTTKFLDIPIAPLPCFTKIGTFCDCDCVDCRCDCDDCRCDCDHCRCDCDHCYCDSTGGYSPVSRTPPEGCETHYRTFFKIAKTGN